MDNVQQQEDEVRGHHIANRRPVYRRKDGGWNPAIPKAIGDAYFTLGCQLEWQPVSPTELRVVVIPPGVGPRRTRRKSA